MEGKQKWEHTLDLNSPFCSPTLARCQMGELAGGLDEVTKGTLASDS